jgi:exosortase E/protease (VPEID-CTERM system)
MRLWPDLTPSASVGSRLPESGRAIERRITLLFIYIACQFAVLKLMIFPGSVGNYLGIALPTGIFQFILYFTIGFFLLLSMHFLPVWRELLHAAKNHSWRRLVLPQVIAYLIIIYSASRLLPTEFPLPRPAAPGMESWRASLLASSIVLTTTLSLGLIAPALYWWQFLRKEWTTFLLAGIFPLSQILIYSWVLRSEDLLSVPTIAVVRFLLGLCYEDVHFDFTAKTVGTPSLTAIVDHMCSGYEGIGMITVFLVWYLYSFKRDFRFPMALLLFPIAALAIWLSNCLRIALIVIIGTSLSSDIAMEGFHINGGWIFFISTALGIVWLARNNAFFCRKAGKSRIVIDRENAFAVPFLVLLAATLITSAFSAGFPWLYPLRIAACAGAIIFYWDYFDLRPGRTLLIPILAGVGVFLFWIMMVAPDVEADKRFSGSLFAVPALWSAAWIAIRLCGSLIVAPIAEELAFRGYIPAYLENILGNKHGPATLHWAPFVVSSLLFGALHSAWIAGTIAGTVYYMLRRHSGRLWDSIVAHMTTNFLISAYVLIHGYWSYW